MRVAPIEGYPYARAPKHPASRDAPRLTGPELPSAARLLDPAGQPIQGRPAPGTPTRAAST
jgi:hypothetical protein